MAFDRRLMANFDWMTFSLTLLIMAFSTVILYSATYNRPVGAVAMHLKQVEKAAREVIGRMRPGAPDRNPNR